jgi:putative copper resistance protein D
MDWSAAGAALIATRALHFAATAIVAGLLLFRVTVAKPASRADAGVAKLFWGRTRLVLWAGVAAMVATGALWLLLEAASMSGLPFGEAITADVLGAVLNETQFGEVTEIRCGLVLMLAVCLTRDRPAVMEWFALASALALAGSIAWTGHAGSTPGTAGKAHLAADALHLCAASAWIGGLLALVIFFAAARRIRSGAWVAMVHEATVRFSLLGIASVAMIAVTGVINAYILVGSIEALLSTDYGRLLMVKLAVVAAMLALAAVNRFRLTAHLTAREPAASDALRQLARNSRIEILLGLAIFALVGALGTMHPAVHMMK